MIVTKEQIMKQEHKLYLKVLANGTFGGGKTYLAMTFPKFAYAMIEPNGIQTGITNPDLFANMKYFESFVPSSGEDILQTFNRLSAFIKKVREDMVKGEVETFILDNLTHLSEARWQYIEKYEKTVGKNGAVDTRGMYGTLGRWLYRFTVTECLSLPGHVVITAHQQEEQVENDKGQLVKTGKILTDTLGGFRNEVAGLVNASIFLEEKRLANGERKYRAICKSMGGKEAKNNIGLPEVVENISFSSIVESINKAKQTKENK